MRLIVVVIPSLLVVGSGCQAFTDIFGPRWGPDVVEGTYVEDRDDGGEPWVLELESGKSPPNPDASLGDNGTDDGNVVVGTLVVGTPHNEAEASIYDALAPTESFSVRGIVAGFDLEREEGALCGDGILALLSHDSTLDDAFIQIELELIIDDDGEADVMVKSRGGAPETPGDFPEVEVTSEWEREEGRIIRPACRDNSDDESYTSPDSGGGDSDLFD
jgi:hypothetical protein